MDGERECLRCGKNHTENGTLCEECKTWAAGLRPKRAPASDVANHEARVGAIGNALELLARAIATDARRVSVGPILPSLVDVRRKNDKRPADIRIAVDDSVAQELKPGADPNKRTVWMLVGVPRDFAVELELAKQEQAAAKERRIITPMEAARGLR